MNHDISFSTRVIGHLHRFPPALNVADLQTWAVILLVLDTPPPAVSFPPHLSCPPHLQIPTFLKSALPAQASGRRFFTSTRSPCDAACAPIVDLYFRPLPPSLSATHAVIYMRLIMTSTPAVKKLSFLFILGTVATLLAFFILI